MKTKTLDKIIKILDSIDVDGAYIINENIESIDEIDDIVYDYRSKQDFIYSYNAIDYLRENDPSFQSSLQIAKEKGYDIGDLDSEVLATLLMQENRINDYKEIRDEIETLLDDDDGDDDE